MHVITVCIIAYMFQVGDHQPSDLDRNSDEHKLREFVKRIIRKIKSTPGNDRCVDCGKPG